VSESGGTWLTVEEAVERLGVSARWLRKHWIKLPFVYESTTHYEDGDETELVFEEDELEQWVEEGGRERLAKATAAQRRKASTARRRARAIRGKPVTDSARGQVRPQTSNYEEQTDPAF
jgi:TPP-dependent indolepyruvate ferredoxin oxidoreductase alpha subunit